jgi:hypothetical protein
MVRVRRLATVFLCIHLFCSQGAAGTPGTTDSGRVPGGMPGDSLSALEAAVSALANPAADYRNVLGRTLAQLSADDRNFLKTEIASFLQRAPVAGVDFKCGADFMRDMARKELWRLKDAVLDWKPEPVQPRVCYAAPYAIDSTRLPQTLEIYGYDFDQVALELFVMDRKGFFKDVTHALAKKSRYHLTVDLGEKGVTFAPDDDALALSWGHLVRHWIPLVQSTTPICSSSLEEVPAGKEIAYELPPIASGRGFEGTGAKVLANAALDFESNKIDATICTTAQGRTPISGCAVEYVYTSDAERQIEWVFGNLQAEMAYTRGDRPTHMSAGAPRGPVAQWRFDGFGRDSLADTKPRMTVRLRKVRLVSTQPEGCISAIQYLEARRQGAMSSGTVRRLDPELRRIDRDILKLRPRFAPPLS